MPIEVRQLLIKSTVESTQHQGDQAGSNPVSEARLREEIIAECKLWLEEKLQHLRER